MVSPVGVRCVILLKAPIGPTSARKSWIFLDAMLGAVGPPREAGRLDRLVGWRVRNSCAQLTTYGNSKLGTFQLASRSRTNRDELIHD